MNTLDFRQYYERNLPHIIPPGATFFVTCRLAGSIPKSKLRLYLAKKEWLEDEAKRLRQLTGTSDSPELMAHLERFRAFKREWFVNFEDILHQAQSGPVWLKENAVARIVVDSLHFLDGTAYIMHAYCVMSNHAHLLFQPLLTEAKSRAVIDETGRCYFESEHPTLARIMKSLKGYTAREANKVLGRKGAFWEPESYDHYVRNAAEFDRIVNYILNNPVKAGLVQDWHDWQWSYRRECAAGFPTCG